MTHEFTIGASITLILTACPIDDTSDGENADVFQHEAAVVVRQLHGDQATYYAADYLVYVPKTRRVYPCVPANMADAPAEAAGT